MSYIAPISQEERLKQEKATEAPKAPEAVVEAPAEAPVEAPAESN